MATITELFEQKKIENEFQNQSKDFNLEGPMARQEYLIAELRAHSKKLKSFDFQADQLYERLRKLQKNVYDDMIIIDSKPVIARPWKSSQEHMRSKYSFWDVTPTYLHIITKPLFASLITEVAIRKEGNQKAISVIDNICRRLQNLDGMAKTIYYASKDIKNELHNTYGVTKGDILDFF